MAREWWWQLAQVVADGEDVRVSEKEEGKKWKGVMAAVGVIRNHMDH
ncbi:uncharacterized protein G2W53_042656 [Senna tora]|uniref:Uncharacterized protein n=1 Tax=Senna tora TaxID=362788 RepID=A0A834SFQ7_9FABA|nr:uncharacterized protein G2W53_042656 [Senna tora]